MRAPVPSSSWLNRTSLGETALNSFTGTLTSPKLMAPLQIALGMDLVSHLSHDLPGVLVVALALVGRVAQDADARPLGEGHLDDEFRVDPRRLPGHRLRRRGVEGRRVAPEGVEEPEQPGELGLGEAGADPPGEAEPPIVLIDAEEEGPQPPPRPFPGQEAADDELLGAVVLDLQPVPGADAGFVERVEPLGHDTL